MDPLSILKEFVISKRLDDVVIDQQADTVRFGDQYSFPKHSLTAFRANAGKGEFFTLEAVVTFIKVMESGGGMPGAGAEYTKQAMNMQRVPLPDRQPLREWLTGKISHAPQIADEAPAVPLFQPAAKRQKVAEPEPGEAAALQHLFDHEKQLRDRNSLLCAPGADFKSVLHMCDRVMTVRKQVQEAAARAAARAAQPSAPGKPQQAPGQQRHPGKPSTQQHQQPAKQQPFMKSSARMEREVDTKGTLQALGADAKTAATVGLGYGIAAAKPSGPKPSSRQPPPGGSSKGGSDPRAAAAAAAKGAAGKGGSIGGGRRQGPVPIILVPSGVTAMLNMYNARAFLEEGKFVKSEEAMAAAGSKQSSIEIRRQALREDRAPDFPRYQITDKVPNPGHPDWKRVVAVIVQGKAWQFKGFPFKGADKGETFDTFSNLFGAYFHYSDEKVPDNVQGWKVVKLPLRRTARHLDHTVMLDFYKLLDQFLQNNRRDDLDY